MSFNIIHTLFSLFSFQVSFHGWYDLNTVLEVLPPLLSHTFTNLIKLVCVRCARASACMFCAQPGKLFVYNTHTNTFFVVRACSCGFGKIIFIMMKILRITFSTEWKEKFQPWNGDGIHLGISYLAYIIRICVYVAVIDKTATHWNDLIYFLCKCRSLFFYLRVSTHSFGLIKMYGTKHGNISRNNDPKPKLHIWAK